MKSKRFRFQLITIVMLFMFLFTACGSKKDMSIAPETAAGSPPQMNVAQDSKGFGGVKSEEKPATATDKAAENGKNVVFDSQRKIIKSGSATVETLKFEESLDSLMKGIEALGGYIESSNISGKRNLSESYVQNRSANIVARVPKASFDSFLNNMSNFGNVTVKNISGQDVTAEYFDTEARLKSLSIQEERILELLKKATELKDVVELERHLSELRYQIESLTGTLKRWDNMVDYSQVSINLIEVGQLTSEEKIPVTLGDKILLAFKNSTKGIINLGKNFIVFLAAVVPYAVIIGILVVILRFIGKKFKIKPFKINFPPKNKKE
jgi:hypothetical protein